MLLPKTAIAQKHLKNVQGCRIARTSASKKKSIVRWKHPQDKCPTSAHVPTNKPLNQRKLQESSTTWQLRELVRSTVPLQREPRGLSFSRQQDDLIIRTDLAPHVLRQHCAQIGPFWPRGCVSLFFDIHSRNRARNCIRCNKLEPVFVFLGVIERF